MATDSARRAVSIGRTAPGQFTAINSRGGRITLGAGGDERFTPTELQLAAIGCCTAIDVDILTSDAIRKSHDRLCTVGRTVELGTPIKERAEPA